MFDFIRKQFIDVIQWQSPDENTLVWRFPIADQEIQNGASLTVRESQAAMFVDEGITADVFGAGRYTLKTQTLPILTNLKNWDKFFESPFKSDVYFFNTRQQIGKRWGTAQPVTVRDTDFGVVQLRSFGMYSYRIVDPALFFKEVSGVVESYSGEQLESQLKNIAMTQMGTAVCYIGRTVFGYGGKPSIVVAKNDRIAATRIRQIGLGFGKLHGGKHYAARSHSKSVGQPHEHGHCGRFGQIHAISNRAGDSVGSAKRRWIGWHWRRFGRGRRPWSGDGRRNGWHDAACTSHTTCAGCFGIWR